LPRPEFKNRAHAAAFPVAATTMPPTTRRTKSKSRKKVPATTATPPKPKPNTSKQNPPHGKQAYSFETNTRFTPPDTQNTLALLMKLWIPGSFLAVSLICCLVWYGLSTALLAKFVDPTFPGTSAWLIAHGAGSLTNNQLLTIACFWRLMYNVFLGVVLRLQSDTHFLTKFIARVQQDSTSGLYSIVNWLIRGTAGCRDPLHDYPSGFNAWMLNMQIVNVILPLDVWAFMMVVFRNVGQPSDCFTMFKDSGTFTIISEPPVWLCSGVSYTAILFGTVLCCMSVMGKRAAFDVIGHYAWFWGDFFYGLDLELKFDGIFDIAPHPMYTVGYGWMYGLALMTGSSHVAALAFGSHFLQIGFLVLVEDPHINKLYGSDVVQQPTSKTLLTQSNSPTKVSKSNVLLLGNFDIFRSSDWQLVSICVLLVCLFLLGSVKVISPDSGDMVAAEMFSNELVLGTALAIRVCGTFVAAMILRQQAHNRFWTQHFIAQGQTIGKAFTEWKRLYNAIDTIMNLGFYLAAFRFFIPNDYVVLQATHGTSYIVTIVLGVLALLGTAAWAERSVFRALGAEGWFYGDFFIPRNTEEEPERPLVYQGIYRYVNNPDVLLGKLWLYGVALATLRVEMFILAIFSHAIAWFFLISVEEPHMKSFYDKKQIRQHSSALTKKFKTQFLPKLAATARAVFYRNHSLS